MCCVPLGSTPPVRCRTVDARVNTMVKLQTNADSRANESTRCWLAVRFGDTCQASFIRRLEALISAFYLFCRVYRMQTCIPQEVFLYVGDCIVSKASLFSERPIFGCFACVRAVATLVPARHVFECVVRPQSLAAFA